MVSELKAKQTNPIDSKLEDDGYHEVGPLDLTAGEDVIFYFDEGNEPSVIYSGMCLGRRDVSWEGNYSSTAKTIKTFTEPYLEFDVKPRMNRVNVRSILSRITFGDDNILISTSNLSKWKFFKRIHSESELDFDEPELYPEA